MEYNTLAMPWSAGPETAPILPIRPNSKFFFKHHPRNWALEKVQVPGKKKGEVEMVWKWLPIIETETEKPGVNGIRLNGKFVDATGRHATLARRGYTIFLPNQIDYLRVYPCRGGRYYAHKFMILEDVAGEFVETLDRNAWNEWRMDLVRNGDIKLPHPQLLKRLLLRRSRHIDRYIRQQHIPELAAKMETIRSEVQAMQTGINELQDKGIKYYG